MSTETRPVFAGVDPRGEPPLPYHFTGFPRWDGPTDRAFEDADRADEGPFGGAMAGLGVEPA